MAVRFMTADQAAELIRDGSTIATGGFVGSNNADELLKSIEDSFLTKNTPANLTLYYAAGQGDGDYRAVNRLGHEGLLKRIVGGHWNTAPMLQKLALENKVEAYNFPQGIISHMFRDASSKKPFTMSKVGLKTFVDPDLEGGKLNEVTKEDLVRKVKIDNGDFLLYDTPKLDYVILRGTYSDEFGNVTLEHENVVLDTTSMAIACKNNGGTVIVQVKDIVEGGSLDPRLVKLSNTIVDVIVKTSDPHLYHEQSFNTYHERSHSGEIRTVLSSVEPAPLNNRKIIGRRGAMLMNANSVVNLGIGIPEVVASVVNEEGQGDQMTLTVESGIHGGVPQGGQKFGAAINPYMIVDQDKQFDFYDGGGLDITFLGLAECDKIGNINVSKFGPRIAGCGGFINISQNTKRVVFCGTFTAGGLKERIEDGKLIIENEGRNKKFIKEIEQITFSAEYANETEQEVMYITERAVFKLVDGGLLLIEIAPGIDLQKDILDQMEFEPIISENLKEMDQEIFRDGKMGLILS